MATIDEIKKARLAKLDCTQRSLVDPYPGETKRTHSCQEALDEFDKLSKVKKEIVLTGRIKSLRAQGALCFFDINDGTAKLQAFLKKDAVGEKAYEFFLNIFDIGDFVEVKGVLFKTKRGEKTIEVSNYKMLGKSLLPLPDKWYGLQDAEERFRKRYLDLICNPEVRKIFETRSKIIKTIREFLDKEGFLEVETPILQRIYGGAKAKPFKTHLNSLDMDLFLRISPELYLKRLLVGGFTKVYEVAKCFRNEGIDRVHNPDFTMLEFYVAYADYKDLMKLTEKMFKNILDKVVGFQKINYEDKEINFETPYPRVEFSDIFEKCTKIKYEDFNAESLALRAEDMGVKIEKGSGKAEIIDQIYTKCCRPKIIEPTFVIHYPAGFQPLAKQLKGHPEKLANFQLVVNGMEIVNAFSELNDPTEQRKRFEEQEKLFKQGFEEAQRRDEDFLEALEYGMPPAAGFGMGIDRLVALLTNSHSLREAILFPTMRSK